MSDRRLRELERRLEQDPSDQDALTQAIAARQRAGLPVPGRWLVSQVFGARSFDYPEPASVSVLTPDGRRRTVGTTPNPGGLALPEHRAWWLQPLGPSDAGLARAAELLASEPHVGLSVGPDVSAAGLGALRRFSGLRRLDLSGCAAVDDGALAAIAAIPGLGWLDMWGCGAWGEAGLAALSASAGLVGLSLSRCAQLTDANCAHLSALRELVTLDLSGCLGVGDAGLAALAELPALGYLDLRGCDRLTDAACEALARLPELTVLNLSLCPGITPAGLRALRAAPRLREVWAVGSGVTGQAVAEAALPERTVRT
ncbi:MAG: hypothetical protein KDD82_02525 [Planctomycetes bacterium]|nr:hypothetical protein [Planctomycetota bacterium]